MRWHALLFWTVSCCSVLLEAGPREVLVVVTSTDRLESQGSSHITGCWPEELIEPYLIFTQAGFRVTIASPRGGAIPLDPSGLDAGIIGEENAARYRRLLREIPVLGVSVPLSYVLTSSRFEYDVVFLAGGHGTLVDFPNNRELEEILTRACRNKAIVAGVCHGVVGLLNLQNDPLMRGSRLTGFSDREEEIVQMTHYAKTYLGDTVATMLERMVKDGGYECAGEWQSHVVNHHNRLITGQNPTSSAPLAREIVRVVQSLSDNEVKAAIAKGYPVFGSFVTIGHPTVVEVLGLSGIDFVWVEGEHAALSLPQILSLNMATSESGIVPIVRVPTNHSDVIKQYVDTGAMGIIVPIVKTRDDAHRAVCALKYPPRGERGIGLGRATRYFIKLQDYLARANRDVMVMLMIETKEAVDNIEDILTVPGIDLLCVGPFDLSASMGYIGEPSHPEVKKAVEKVEVAAMRAGVPLGISVPDKKAAYRLMARGYRFFVIGADVEYLFQSAKTFMEQPVTAEKIEDEWEIATDLKFHYAYLDPDSIAGLETVPAVAPPPASFSTGNGPDISNIHLHTLLRFGFPVPFKTDPETYKFFLKFYHYPSHLDAALSARRLLSPFLLDKMKGADKIYRFAQNPANVYVKKGLIADENRNFDVNPFPPLKIPAQDLRCGSMSLSPQCVFDHSIPFFSFYLKTSGSRPPAMSDDEFADWTTRGLLDFHRELIAVYRKYLTEVKGPDQGQFYYFLDPGFLHPPTTPVHVDLLKVPRQPLLFRNYRDLPMPHNPRRIFLSGLLLVFRSNCILEKPQEFLQDSSPNLSEYLTETGTLLLEVVSVAQFDQDKR